MTGPVAEKIDVQGAKSFVIAGGTRIMGQAGAVAMEVSPYHISKLDGDIETILACLGGVKRIASVGSDSDASPVFQPAAEAIPAIRGFCISGRIAATGVMHLPCPPRQRFPDVYAPRD